MPAGAALHFRTSATSLELEISCPPPDPPPSPLEAAATPARTPIDVVVDGTLVHRGLPLSDRLSLALPDSLPSGSGVKSVEIWLPQFGEVRVGALHLNAPALPPAPPLLAAPLWVTYGSSITQCRAAAGPTSTWPALVARSQGWRLRCLGFAGECHLDPVAIRAVRDTPAALISLCLGINIYGKATLTSRTLPGLVSGAIHTIREAHPTTPLVVITPIASPAREHTRNQAGLTLADVRHLVAEATTTRQHLGDRHLHLVDGLDILPLSEAPSALPDGLHPSAQAYELLATRLAPALAQHLHPPSAPER